jgi:hypothetical protein
VNGQKKVVPLIVGKPDLTRLPLIGGKDAMHWSGDAKAVARRVKAAVGGNAPRRPAGMSPSGPWGAPSTAPHGVRPVQASTADGAVPYWLKRAGPAGEPPKKRSLIDMLFNRKPE